MSTCRIPALFLVVLVGGGVSALAIDRVSSPASCGNAASSVSVQENPGRGTRRLSITNGGGEELVLLKYYNDSINDVIAELDTNVTPGKVLHVTQNTVSGNRSIPVAYQIIVARKSEYFAASGPPALSACGQAVIAQGKAAQKSVCDEIHGGDGCYMDHHGNDVRK